MSLECGSPRRRFQPRAVPVFTAGGAPAVERSAGSTLLRPLGGHKAVVLPIRPTGSGSVGVAPPARYRPSVGTDSPCRGFRPPTARLWTPGSSGARTDPGAASPRQAPGHAPGDEPERSTPCGREYGVAVGHGPSASRVRTRSAREDEDALSGSSRARNRPGAACHPLSTGAGRRPADERRAAPAPVTRPSYPPRAAGVSLPTQGATPTPRRRSPEVHGGRDAAGVEGCRRH